MQHTLPELPYSVDALSPYISRETLEYHHGKHLQTYVDNLNKLIVDTKYADMTLEEIVKNSDGAIFNNAGQVWNHTFYFFGFTPNGLGKPTGKIAEMIEKDFGSFEAFQEQFTASALGNFGSGWTWLVINTQGILEIVNTSNAGTPLTQDGITILLTCDVWEHAYYIDTRNSRPKYLENFWQIVDWERVNSLV